MLLRAVNEDSIDVEEVARAVSLDEVLTAHVMRRANSASLGFRSPAHTVSQAVARLGCATVRSLALAQAVSRSVPLLREVGGVPRAACWEHNWAVAHAAMHLAKLYGIARGEAHLAGLLHDVGKLVLAANLPQRYEACVQEAGRTGLELCRVERVLLARDHASVGSDALCSWDLPRIAVQAAAEHHMSDRDRRVSAVGQLVHAADCIVHAAGIGCSGNASPLPLAECIASDRTLTTQAVETCLETLERDRESIRELAQELAGDSTVRHGRQPAGAAA